MSTQAPDAPDMDAVYRLAHASFDALVFPSQAYSKLARAFLALRAENERLRQEHTEIERNRFSPTYQHQVQRAEAAEAALQATQQDAAIVEAAKVLAPLLEAGWDEYDDDKDQAIGSAAVDEFIKAVNVARKP